VIGKTNCPEMGLRNSNWLLTLTQWPHKCFWIISHAKRTTSSHCTNCYTTTFNHYRSSAELILTSLPAVSGSMLSSNW